MGCRARAVVPGPPIEFAASGALYDAWCAQRELGAAAPDAIAAALAAADLDPTWVAPQRLLDDALRAELRGPEALALRRAALAAGPEDAAAHYLAARLGGPDADRLLDRAAALDPRLGWAWHGLAWNAHQRGDQRRALALGDAALALARDPHEVTHFTHALTRYLIAVERSDAAVRVLESTLFGRSGEAAPAADSASLPGSGDVTKSVLAGSARSPVGDLRPLERLYLGVELALGELSTGLLVDTLARGGGAESGANELLARAAFGAQRALTLLSMSRVTEGERAALVRAMGRRRDIREDDVLLALSGAARSNDVATDGLRADLLEGRGALQLAAALRARDPDRPARDRLVDAFRAGDPRAPFEEWLRELPLWTKSKEGLPRLPALAALTNAVRDVGDLASRPSAEASGVLAERLLEAGWFEEAEALAVRGVLPVAVAEDVLRRALADRAALTAVGELLAGLDRGGATELEMRLVGRGVDGEFSGTTKVGLAKVRSLAGLLGAVQRRFDERRILAGLAPLAANLIEDSPRIRYGPVASVVHPGPTFSAEDQRLGRGEEGAPVPGLAAEMARLGRHALFGVAPGQGGPDGAILRLVCAEQRTGEHLGRPYHGTVFWCYGADVPARFARRGASISGAALHEGYWVDLERVEAERDGWRRLRARFLHAPQRVRAALSARGPEVTPTQRAEFDPALGAADRMRLAWMVEHGDVDEPALVSLGALAEVVAIHEEGHLCDRAAWYPLGENLWALLRFAASQNFSPERIAEALEERAQLVALACTPDSRLAWIDVLDAAERSGPSITPHAAGYRRVLERLLARLSNELDAGEWPELDGQRRLVDQLHRLDSERLRGLAVREARAAGLSNR